MEEKVRVGLLDLSEKHIFCEKLLEIEVVSIYHFYYGGRPVQLPLK